MNNKFFLLVAFAYMMSSYGMNPIDSAELTLAASNSTNMAIFTADLNHPGCIILTSSKSSAILYDTNESLQHLSNRPDNAELFKVSPPKDDVSGAFSIDNMKNHLNAAFADSNSSQNPLLINIKKENNRFGTVFSITSIIKRQADVQQQEKTQVTQHKNVTSIGSVMPSGKFFVGCGITLIALLAAVLYHKGYITISSFS